MEMKALFYVVLLVLTAACNQVGRQPNTILTGSGDTLSLMYAEGFNIVYHSGYKEVIVNDPWQAGQVFARYFLVFHDSIATPADGIKMLMPVSNLAVTSATHLEFLALLGVIDRVNGVCSPELIYNAFIQHQLKDGNLENLGDAFNINVEKTLRLQPGMLMMSGYKQDDPYAKRVMQAGIPVVYNNEWMENSLLARAEWIKFIAVFFDKEQEADSIFNFVHESYLSVKVKAQAVELKPKILSGSNFRGTWYMPGGNSFMARLFADAGGDYFYADDDSKGSLPLNVESVLNHFAQADVWLNCNFETLDELMKSDKKHALFKPVASNRVYNFNKRMLPSSANDFWESAVARPDLLLRDVISVLHPDLLPEHQLIYTAQLK
jgi:iron complex transport system substrate-binding protein